MYLYGKEKTLSSQIFTTEMYIVMIKSNHLRKILKQLYIYNLNMEFSTRHVLPYDPINGLI